MHPGPDSMGAPSSFTARRPNASALPQFELPPPMSNLKTFPSFHQNINQSQSSAAPGTISSVGNLLTPPINLQDGLGNSNPSQNMSSYSQNGYVWSPPPQGTTPYGFQPQNNGNSNQPYATPRAGLPPPPYELSLPPFPSSGSMSAPATLPTMSGQHQAMSSMIGNQTPVSSSAPHHSPIHSQDSFSRQPPTPTYQYNSQPQSNHQQSSYSYSTGPSPTQHSPLSAGPMLRSPAHSAAHVPSLQSAHSHSHSHSHSPNPYQQRPYQGYPLPGPVLSNVNNPNGQLALVGGMPHSMMSNFNSGHAANMQHMYGGHHPTQAQPANDRPFKCDQCPQSFNRNHDLKRHKRIHLAVKPFPCGHCDKSFSRKDALKRHILVKGCGKAAAAAADAEKHDGSISPTDKSIGSEDHKPHIH